MSDPYNPNLSSAPDLQTTQYVSQIVSEFHTIAPLLQSLPICTRLLNQELSRASGMSISQVLENQRNPNQISNSSTIQNAMSFFSQPNLSRQSGMVSPIESSYKVKKGLRLYIPVNNADPNNQFIGRVLGQKSGILKSIEDLTDCRIRVNGKGSMRNPYMEERLKVKPGFEHLNGPLNISIEGDLPANIIDLQIKRAQSIIEEMACPMKLRVGSFYCPGPSSDLPKIEYTNVHGPDSNRS